MCDNLWPNPHTKVKLRSHFCDFDAFADHGGRDWRKRALLVVPTDEPDQGTCSAMLSAQRAAFRLDLFASESLLKTPGIGLYVQNENSFSLPRAICELYGRGADRLGYWGEPDREGPTDEGYLGK
jgi:hypothetical protein